MATMGAGVHKSELNWNTYQERQLDVLTELRNSFQTSLSLSKSSEMSLSRINTSLNDVAKSLSTIAGRLQSMFPDLQRTTQNYTNSMTEAANTIRSQQSTVKGFGDVLDIAAEAAKRHAESEDHLRQEMIRREEDKKRQEEEERERREEEKKFIEDRRITIKQLEREALSIMSSIGRIANNYSEASNNLIKFTGSGAAVRDYRSTAVGDIVAQLNRETGNYYSGTEAYAQMVSIANSAGIGSLDTLKELTRPVLLAQESIDVNISEMAKLLGRWSNRYTFNSASMESMINDIRGYTADNNASAEAALRNVAQLENWIAYTSKGDTAKMEEMSEAVTKGTAWLESMNVDTNRYTQYITKLLSGEALTDKGMNILLGGNVTSAYNLAQTGQFDQLYKLLFESEVSAWDKYMEGNLVKSQTAGAMGYDLTGLLDAYNAYGSEGYVGLDEFTIRKSTETAVEAVESKYVSFEDRVNNWLSQLYEKVAKIQEHLGFGLTDITAGILLVSQILSRGSGIGLGRGGGLGQLLGKIGGRGAAAGAGAAGSSAGSAILGGLGTVAVGAAGLGLAAKGGIDIYQDFNTGDVSGLTGLSAAGGAAGAIGAGLVLASNPIGWGVMLAGAGALAARELYEFATKVGSADGIAGEMKDAQESLNKNNLEYQNKLYNLSAMLDNEATQEQARQELIQLGIGTQEDNISALKDLTNAYIEASKKMTDEANAFLSKYGLENQQYASQMQSSLSTNLKAYGATDTEGTTQFMYSLLQSLESRRAGGESFDKDTQKLYDRLVKSLSDGSLTSSEINTIMRGKAFQHANLKPEDLMSAMKVLEQTGDVGAKISSNVNASLKDMTYYGSTSEIMEVANLVAGLNSGNLTDDEKRDYLARLTELDAGKFAEASELMTGFSYAKGTNYITRDQLAYLHAGESVTPARYNPAANMNELEYLRKESEEYKRDKEEKSNKYLSDLIDVMKDTKALLVEWKRDNAKEQQKTRYENKFNTRNAVTNPR